MLVTVGTGAAVVGAADGAVVGGERVGLGAAVVGATEGAVVAGAGLGEADGCPGVPAADEDGAAADVAPGRDVAGCVFPVVGAAALPVGAAVVVADVAAGVAGAGVWLAVCDGAVRANTTANPTVVSAPSCVVRQVSLRRRRSPAARACGE